MKLTAAVTETRGAPFTLEELELGELRDDETLVAVAAVGICLPRRSTLHLQGRFPVEKLMTFYDFDQIDQAAHDAEAGTTIKPVLGMS